jgi:hypothetical protein
MVYHGDPAIPQPHDVPPDDLAELAARMATPPTPVAQELIIDLARRHPGWGVERIRARIRRDPGRHDISVAQIAWVLLQLRQVRPMSWENGLEGRGI